MGEIEDNIEVLITEDGSSSLRRKDLREGYHSTFGAIAEGVHIFINAGLRNIEKHSLINVLEIGFGTGLNAILTLDYSNKESQNIYYETIEKYPLSQEIISQLNYGKVLLLEDEFLKIHSVSWNKNAEINNLFSIHKIDKPAENLNYKANFFDIIYFDAFAPQFEENLWQQEMFAKLYSSLKEGGLLVTYCCKGDVKRALRASGFQIEKLPGPKGKREILRAKKI